MVESASNRVTLPVYHNRLSVLFSRCNNISTKMCSSRDLLLLLLLTVVASRLCYGLTGPSRLASKVRAGQADGLE